ncbi:TIGR01777 family oxidoreductase [Flavobacterium algicola]|uniref:TIGR01777 family oxidoreductase n=1 Tax=Flavobacterium algicola TaxID=556529 RepID=UPI001EFEAF3E|nr:TIGR01777 family oxidoreductase [Flavobacterium algicola]MCG9790933.1 TIGR01777 family oxidoreductase [Flavobacterium algicola]
MKKKVLITGGTGFVGSHLTKLLVAKGFEISILSRSKKVDEQSISYYVWDVDKGIIDEKAVLDADFIIHLAGENIAGSRWTEQRKKDIVTSRVAPVALIKTVLEKNNKKLEAFISASGVGIYGAITDSKICKENTDVYNDFLGETCQKWEAAADTISPFANRVVKVRTGLALGKDGGFLEKMLPLFKWGLGSAIGSGKQYMPWIHIDDLCAIYLEGLRNPAMNGAYNATIQDNTTNKIFAKTLTQVLGYKMWFPAVPSFMMRLLLGEMSVIILEGRRVSSSKIEKLGFRFKYINLENALQDCI